MSIRELKIAQHYSQIKISNFVLNWPDLWFINLSPTRVQRKLNECRSNVTRRLESLIFNKFRVLIDFGLFVAIFCCACIYFNNFPFPPKKRSENKCVEVFDDVLVSWNWICETHHIIAIIVYGDCKSNITKTRQKPRIDGFRISNFCHLFRVEVGVSCCYCEKQETLIQFWCCPAMNASYLIDFWLRFKEAD